MDELQEDTASNTVTCGYLARVGKGTKPFGLKRKRFYKLDGAIFSKHTHPVSSFVRYGSQKCSTC